MIKDPLNQPIQYIKGVGPKRAAILSRIGILTPRDALYYIPFRYEDRRIQTKIANIRYDQFVTLTGQILSAELRETYKGKMKIFEIVITDGSGILIAKWFNQPFMKKLLKAGQKIILSGTVKKNTFWGVGFEMHNPEFELIEEEAEDSIHSDRIVPVYRATAGFTARQLRTLMHQIISQVIELVEDYMPEEILRKYNLPPLKEALWQIHFPDDKYSVEELNRKSTPFHKRLAFDELFLLQAGLAILKKGRTSEKGYKMLTDGRLIRQLKQHLPFNLTAAQQRVIHEIFEDMQKPVPMNRLLQGDVGAGKTIVALFAMLKAVEAGYQTAIMAPTEILAEQHYLNIHALVERLGLRCELLTGSRKDKPLEDIANGNVDIVIGTHALIQETVVFKKLGLVVIDEQHRFGVMQRAALRQKGQSPHVLVMTATPIPRTLSLTLYGDLDYSVLDELPPNRRAVITKLFKASEKRIMYTAVKTELKKGHQAYIVYPLIEESEKMQLLAATNEFEKIKKIFPEYTVGLLHGKMKPYEKEDIMKRFKEGKIQVLVCTTVVEVGVDVPNATVMVIEHAERFGLAQLHQLRGRVGRGGTRAYCFLVAHGRLTEEAIQRLQIMIRETDGFKIAEEDFKLRGPGELFGTRQSGMPDLKTADLIKDSKLLSYARNEAFKLIEAVPELSPYPALKARIEEFWRDKLEIFITS